MRIKNLPSIESMDGSQDALCIEQTDGSEDKSRKVSPAQIKQYVQTGDFEATGEITDGHGNILKDMAKSADVNEVIGDLSQTGIMGDNVAEQLSQLNDEVDAIDIAKADIFVSQTTSTTTHSINVGTVPVVANRMFLLSSGYPSTYVFGLVFITSTNDIRYIDISHSNVTVSSITYSAGVVTVTLSGTTYTRIELIRLC